MTEDLREARNSYHAVPPSAAAAATQALSRLTDLARTSLQIQTSLARHSVDLTWATLAGDLDRTSANKTYLEAVARETVRYWRTIGELCVDYATDLVTLSRGMTVIALREVAAAGRWRVPRESPGLTDSSAEPRTYVLLEDPRLGSADSAQGHTSNGHESLAGAAERQAGRRWVTVSLQGTVGKRAEGRVMVANRHNRARRISLSAGDLVGSQGTPVGAAITVSPDTITLPGGQERWVRLGIDLDAASVSAGELYFSTVNVTGGDEATVEVSVEVTD